jgi:uncharacterized membrane protein YeaQ/YmgE (transglycosylase-associated protein family)
MGIIITIIVGFFAGLLARFLKPGNDQMGFFMTILLGIAGSFVGGYVGEILGFYHMGEPVGFVGSILGAILILFLMDLVGSSRKSR